MGVGEGRGGVEGDMFGKEEVEWKEVWMWQYRKFLM